VSKTQLTFAFFGVQDYVLPFSLPTNEWTHLAVAVDPLNDAYFYVNGQLEGTVPGDEPGTTNSQEFYVGRSAGASSSGWGYLAGGLDEVAVYGRTLEAAEVMQHYVVGTATTQGDANFDGEVDFTDFVRLFNNYTGSFGSGKLWTQGDFDFDGDVDFSDFVKLFNNYTGSPKSGTVPEPSALSLLAVVVLIVLGCAWRRRRR
jgi:hypothetical protein